MELAFETKFLRDVCERETKAKQELGASVAGSLKRRIADLQAAESIFDLPAGNPKVASPEGSLDLAESYVIRFCANHTKNPVLSSGEIDWSKVDRIRILGIEKKHA